MNDVIGNIGNARLGKKSILIVYSILGSSTNSTPDINSPEWILTVEIHILIQSQHLLIRSQELNLLTRINSLKYPHLQ